MKIPLIFDIKRASTNDGPGLRTVIFFKGCNLDCFWCHNPEGKSEIAQIAYFKEKCVSCGACNDLCDASNESIVEACPEGARKLYGKSYTSDELLRIIKADKTFFDATDGGVTFSGGECMLYPEYLTSLAASCRELGISVAIDTAGCVPFSYFEAVLPYTDIFLYDIKCIDAELHKKGTGRDNSLIISNLEKLIGSGKRIIIRVPMIPNFNDGDGLECIKDFCDERHLSYELLPYHEFGESKKQALSHK